MKSNAPLWIVSLGQGPGGGGGLPGMAEVDGFTFVSGESGPDVSSQAVSLADGTSATIYTMLGDEGYATLSIPEGTFDEQGFEVPTLLAEPSLDPRTFSMNCSKPGVLYAAMIGAGGAGGASGWATANPNYQPQGAPGGAGGLLVSTVDSPYIFLPFEGAYTIVVGGRTPAIASYGLSSGQNTTITHDATGFVVTAVGGGSGGSAASNSGYAFAAGNGGSAGAPLYDYALTTDSEAARRMRGRHVPGQGHDAGRSEGYCAPGAGGAGSVGYDGGSMGTAQGGDGVDLRVALGLDSANAGVGTWATAYTDPDNLGWVAGGGTGRTGTTSSPVAVNLRSKGGGGMSKQSVPDRDAYAHTGSGGGPGNASMIGGSGANGAVHVVVVG